MYVLPLQYMPWLSRACLQTTQWCFFLKFLSLKECEPIFPNYISTHTKTSKLYSSRYCGICMYSMYIWQELNPNTSANPKHDIKEHWAHMSTRPQLWWYEENKSVIHMEAMNENHVCFGNSAVMIELFWHNGQLLHKTAGWFDNHLTMLIYTN